MKSLIAKHIKCQIWIFKP